MKDKIIIEDSVFYWNKQDYALFYCAENFKRILVDKTKSECVRSFCDNLANKDNVQTTIITPKGRDIALCNLIKELEVLGFVRRVEKDNIDCSLPRHLYLNNDLDNICNEELRLKAARENTSINDLNTINFFIGGKTVESEYHIQCLYPVCSETKLPYDSVVEIIHKVMKINTGVCYNIILSELDSSDEFMSFAYDLERTGQQISFYVLNSKDTNSFFKNLKNINNIEFHIIIDNKNSYEQYSDNIEPSKFKYHYVIRNEQDLDLMEHLYAYQLNIQPFLIAEDNLEFIIKTCFLDINDRMSLNCPANVVFCHQKININNWGKLYVYPDGNVFSSGRKSDSISLGSCKDSISELIAREVVSKVSWRKIRSCEKCSNCVFQWLCPSPSNIEFALGIESICK